MKTITFEDDGSITFSEELADQEKLDLVQSLFDLETDNEGQFIAYTGLYEFDS